MVPDAFSVFAFGGEAGKEAPRRRAATPDTRARQACTDDPISALGHPCGSRLVQRVDRIDNTKIRLLTCLAFGFKHLEGPISLAHATATASNFPTAPHIDQQSFFVSLSAFSTLGGN
ncbi:hypothetical protein [Saccharopolyspora sp. NPDC050642]|uniref:hypothetical protein n=1 Tax=Saccharopolyspora sp. NPDC050642 TaxID=3157099 RepID=UPI0033E017C0